MCSLTTNNKQIETITNIIPLTHNQRVPGSSPGGPTLSSSHCKEIYNGFFYLYFDSLLLIPLWYEDTNTVFHLSSVQRWNKISYTL